MHLVLKRLTGIYLILWFGVNLLFLTDFPFVHTDEPWLSGLSRSMTEQGSPAATEDFFDLYPRHPHALKIIYHMLQIGFIRLFGYSLFTVRLLSLTAGAASLFLFHRLAAGVRREEHPGMIPFLMMVWLSLDVQFLYAAHMARQEILLVLMMLAILNILVRRGYEPLNVALAGGLLGLSLGIHPNAFLIAWPAGLYMLYRIITKSASWKGGMLFLGAAALTASLFVLISLSFNRNFFADYGSYGAPLGVLDPPGLKILKAPRFFGKLFLRQGGTYYTPPVQMQMVLFLPLLALALYRRKGIISLCGVAGYTAGLVILGKYSQPSLVFLFPFYYLLWAEIADRKLVNYLIAFLMGTTLFFSAREITGEKESYAEYWNELSQYLPADGIALGNLYCEYALPEGHFYDWRNLSELPGHNLNLASYMADRNIEYVVLSGEIDFYYRNRPTWNMIYGNPSGWYPQLQELLRDQAVLIGEFESPGYGMRIAAYRYREPWKVRIYKVSISE
ncbi:MAG: hypothetical protein JXA95_00695 [Spirochaetales bacterium]|nr:hypothetical protein [Spirochaetales bacterium]